MSDLIFSGVSAVSRETRLLSADRLNRMMELSGGNAAFKLAVEGGFGGGATTLEQASAYERNALAEFVKSECPSEELKLFLISRYDFFNAEALSKSKHLKFDPTPMLFDCGFLTVSYLNECIANDDYEGLYKPLAEALTEADKLFVEGEADGFLINNLFNKAYFSFLNKTVKHEVLKQIVRATIDGTNLLSAFRCNGDKALQKITFVDGGKRSFFETTELASMSFDALKRECMFDEDRELTLKIAADYFAGKPLVSGENLSDSYALKLLKAQRLNMEGFEQFLLYCLYKINEITNVNVIVVGLNAGADKADIRARLRECYEG